VNRNGTLSAFDVFRYLRQKVSDVSEIDAAFIISYFDSDEDGKISYGDFLCFLLPVVNTTLREEIAQRTNRSAEEISQAVEKALVELFDSEIFL
jgi:hypothetical protein